jgi:hypothetical protein
MGKQEVQIASQPGFASGPNVMKCGNSYARRLGCFLEGLADLGIVTRKRHGERNRERGRRERKWILFFALYNHDKL